MSDPARDDLEVEEALIEAIDAKALSLEQFWAAYDRLLEAYRKRHDRAQND